MNIAFLVSRPDKPSTKFRVQSYLPLLQKEGVNANVFPLSKKIVKRWKIFFYLNHYDLVFIQKKLFSFWELVYIRRQAKKLIYDFDDAVMFKKGEKMDPTNPVRQKRFMRTVRICDWVIAGNQFLLREAKLFSDRISIIPTPVDTERYIPREKKRSTEVTVGWLGSKSTVNYLKPLVPVCSELRNRFPNLKFKLVSDSFQELERFEGIQKIWKEEEEVWDLQSFDIGIMPLPDDPWTNGKCGFKILQYQAAGLPVVCSPVGINREIVTDGFNGYLANSPQEWIDKLSRLITSPELRSRMGKAGRERVEKQYSLKVIWPQFFMTLKRTVN
ncbi:MAG: hypothetical protein DRG25_05605 [Deltaproteobacteria bacterium]|nr:MAG: hypothetical protein DRG25_05605 [Deltaproteobacteria bacterium]